MAVAESRGCLLAWWKPREWRAFQPLEFRAWLVPLRASLVREEVQDLEYRHPWESRTLWGYRSLPVQRQEESHLLTTSRVNLSI